jgi:hypothetical protein
MSKELKIEYRWDEPQETQLANMMVGQVAPLLHHLRILVDFILNEMNDEELQAKLAAARVKGEAVGSFPAEQWDEWRFTLEALAVVLRQRPERKITQRRERAEGVREERQKEEQR